jgi:hypothetical protein
MLHANHVSWLISPFVALIAMHALPSANIVACRHTSIIPSTELKSGMADVFYLTTFMQLGWSWLLDMV